MQTQLISQAVPVGIRWLLAVAGSLLSPTQRPEWFREWYAEFWHTFGSRRGLRRQMWTRAFGAFPDAWILLRQEYGLLRRIRDASRSRSFAVVLPALVMASTALLTNGFIKGEI